MRYAPFSTIEIEHGMEYAALLAIPAVLAARVDHRLGGVHLADAVAPVVLLLLHEIALALNHLGGGGKLSHPQHIDCECRIKNRRCTAEGLAYPRFPVMSPLA